MREDRGDAQIIELSVEELEDMLTKAAKLGANQTIEQLQTNIVLWAGRSILDKAVYFAGIMALGLFFFLKGEGFVKLG